MMTPPLPTTPSSEPNTTSHWTLPSITTATAPMKRTLVDLDAINCKIICSIQTLRQLQEKLQQQPLMTTMMTMSPSDPMPKQAITTTTVHSNLPPKLTETTTNARTSDRLLQIPMMTTTITKTPSQLPIQQASPLYPYSFKLQEQPQPEPITNTLHLTRKNLEWD